MSESKSRKEKFGLLNYRIVCKCCGSGDTLLRQYLNYWIVECLECYTSTQPVDSDVGAVKAWNEGKVS